MNLKKDKMKMARQNYQLIPPRDNDDQRVTSYYDINWLFQEKLLINAAFSLTAQEA